MEGHRLSFVRNVYVVEVVEGSILFVGDNQMIRPRTQALAVLLSTPQYQTEDIERRVGEFDRYPIFQYPIQYPLPAVEVSMVTTYEIPVISVQELKVTSLASASILQIGSTKHVHSESQLKEIREVDGKLI